MAGGSLSRIAAVVAVGFLLLDGVLLLIAASWQGSRALALGGAACLAGAAGMVWLWRAYRRSRQSLAEASREVRGELDAIRDLLRR